MSPRYLLLLGGGRGQRAELVRRLSERTGLETVFSNSPLTVLSNAACRSILVADAGCVLGSLFHRHGTGEPVTCLSANEAALVASTGGSALLSNWWGGYVAAIDGPNGTKVLRDPSGTFPCYHGAVGGIDVFASDADLLVASGVATGIDVEQVGRQLLRAFVPSPATALHGIRELLAGFVVCSHSNFHNQAQCWSPWDHVGGQTATSGEAADRLYRVVTHCVRAWAATRGRLLLSVSGGLDSSIIAACLANGGANTVCLTMFAQDPAGDERTFARALCDHLGLELIERPYRLEDVNVGEPLAAHLPRPRDRTQANAYERVHLAVASEFAADAFVTGNGGDNVFGYSQSAAPVADRYLSQGLVSGVVRTLLDVCEQTGCSVFDAARQAVRLACSSPAHHVRPNALFLARDFVDAVPRRELHHPWLDAPAGALPGQAAHISSILRVQPNLEASRGSHLPVLSPLMSQPIVETCIGIPTWQWREGGRDRSLARRAFASELPEKVLARKIKGTPSRFAAQLLDHFREKIRERVLGGRLASHRLVDRVAAERVLMGDRPIDDLERVRILEIVNAEAWLDHWASRGQTPEPAKPDINAAGHLPRP